MGLKQDLKKNWPLLVFLPVVAVLGSQLSRWSRDWHLAQNVAPVNSNTRPRGPRNQPRVPTGWIGVELDRSEVEGGGVRIQNVFAESPADQAKLVPGDVLVAANQVAPLTSASLRDAIAGTPLGKTLELKRRRAQGGEDTVQVTVVATYGVSALVQATLQAGTRGLVELRRPDNMWDHYHPADAEGTVGPGLAVSALACAALAAAGDDAGDAGRSALEHGLAALLERRDEKDGGLVEPGESVPHRVYANSFLLLALVKADRTRYAKEISEIRAWLANAQIDARIVDELDFHFGGWNYYETPVTLRADVSTASWALEALAAADFQDDVVWSRAGRFLDRCQNFEVVSTAPEDRKLEESFRDGGFGFTPRMSKAGSRDVGKYLTVFQSYGSATADGLRGLVAAGGRRDDRAKAALRWLARNYTVSKNPGFGDEDRGAAWARGIHFYWLAALARGLDAAKVDALGVGNDVHPWPDEVARLIANRIDHSTGTWASVVPMMMENQRPIATSFAVLALAACRDRLAAMDGDTIDGGAAPPPPPPEPQPWLDASVPVLERGRTLFQNKGVTGCTGCHEDAGTGNGPSLIGIADRYLEISQTRTHERAADYLKKHIREPVKYPGLTGRRGKPGVVMQDYPERSLTNAQLDDLVEFLLSRTAGRPAERATEIK